MTTTDSAKGISTTVKIHAQAGRNLATFQPSVELPPSPPEAPVAPLVPSELVFLPASSEFEPEFALVNHRALRCRIGARRAVRVRALASIAGCGIAWLRAGVLG